MAMNVVPVIYSGAARVGLMCAFIMASLLMVLSLVHVSHAGPSKDRKVMTEETNLCRNAQLLFNRFDIGIQEDNDDGLLKSGNTKPVTPTAEIREAWLKDMYRWIDRTRSHDDKVRETGIASALAGLVWECEQAARGYFRESKDPSRTWQANGHLDSFNAKFKRLQDMCPDIRVPVYLTAKLGADLAKRRGQQYAEAKVTKAGNEYARKMLKREICESAQQLMNRVSEPMMKYQGIEWHDNSWRNYHNEIAHGQDLSKKLCEYWRLRWSAKIGGDKEAQSLADSLQTCVHNLYNAAYDSARNAAGRNRSGYEAARRSYEANQRRIAELCAGLSIPSMLAKYPAAAPRVAEQPPPPPPSSTPCEWPCYWDELGLCNCDPQ
jgi:hypothetical protein